MNPLTCSCVLLATTYLLVNCSYQSTSVWLHHYTRCSSFVPRSDCLVTNSCVSTSNDFQALMSCKCFICTCDDSACWNQLSLCGCVYLTLQIQWICTVLGRLLFTQWIMHEIWFLKSTTNLITVIITRQFVRRRNMALVTTSNGRQRVKMNIYKELSATLLHCVKACMDNSASCQHHWVKCSSFI